MTDLINEKYGIVRRVSRDKQTIKIKLPQGGFAEAQNEGFDIGDKVCFVVGPSGRIIKVILKLVADVIVGVANSPLMQSALQSNEEASDEYNPETNGIEDDCPDSRPSVTECPDLYGRKRGADVEARESYPGPEIGEYPTLWFEG
jgi:hypothetical protein